MYAGWAAARNTSRARTRGQRIEDSAGNTSTVAVAGYVVCGMYLGRGGFKLCEGRINNVTIPGNNCEQKAVILE